MGHLRVDPLLRLAGHTVGVPALVGLAAAPLGAWLWVADLAAHFRVQYAVLLAAAMTLCLLGRGRRMGTVYLFAGTIALLPVLWLSWPRLVEPANQERLTILHWNVYLDNDNRAQVADYVTRTDADLVVLQEVDMRWVLDMERLSPAYRIVAVEQRPDNFGIVLFAHKRRPNVTVEQAFTFDPTRGVGNAPAVRAIVTFGGRQAALLAVHTLPPVSEEYASINRLQFDAIGRWVNDHPQPAIVVGDLNASPWAFSFGRLLDQTNLINSQQGFGYEPTWPAGDGGMALRISIDHLLHSPRLITTSRTIGPATGSDHRPMLVSLAWAESH